MDGALGNRTVCAGCWSCCWAAVPAAVAAGGMSCAGVSGANGEAAELHLPSQIWAGEWAVYALLLGPGSGCSAANGPASSILGCSAQSMGKH